MTCVLFVCAAAAVSALDGFDSAGLRLALKVYEDCSKTDGFSPCFKKKALTFLDRLGRMDKLSLTDGVTIMRANDTPVQDTPISEDQLESSLPRAADARDDALNTMLLDKVSNLVSSRTLQISMPKISADDFSLEEGEYFRVCFCRVSLMTMRNSHNSEFS